MTRTAVLVTGSRRWRERQPVLERLRRYPKGTILIHGDNGRFVRQSPEPFDGFWEGLDKIAHEMCSPLGFIPHPYPYFSDLGKLGGPERNACMLGALINLQRFGARVHCEAFPDELSTGTRGMIRLVERHNAKSFCDEQVLLHVTEGKTHG